MILVLLGPPGAGKGTQGERLAEQLGIPKVATGDVLRAAVRAGTPMGLAAKAAMDRGDLVPDDVILGIVKEALATPEMSHGVVLDGVVRTVPQARGLQRVFAVPFVRNAASRRPGPAFGSRGRQSSVWCCWPDSSA